jgi:hypothetical protein
MNKTAIKKADDAMLVSRFEEVARLRGQAWEEMLIAKGNKLTREIMKLRDELRRRGQPSREKLLPMLNHQEPWVRYTAANALLAVDPSHARAVLEELSKRTWNPVGGQAGMSLYYLDNGMFVPR